MDGWVKLSDARVKRPGAGHLYSVGAVALGEPQEFLRSQTRPRERAPQQHGDELAERRPRPLGPGRGRGAPGPVAAARCPGSRRRAEYRASLAIPPSPRPANGKAKVERGLLNRDVSYVQGSSSLSQVGPIKVVDICNISNYRGVAQALLRKLCLR